MHVWIRLSLPVRQSMHGVIYAVAAALGLALATMPAQATLLYGTTAIGSSPRSSDYGSVDSFGFRTFDNFSVSGGGTVLRLTWSGLWFGPVTPAPAPAPDVLSWDIGFYASGAGTPGAQLALQNYLAADVTSTFLGTGVLSAGNTYNVNFYEYSVDLSTPFAAGDGVEYWLSIMARSDNFSPTFAWRAGNGGDDVSYQQTLGAGASVTTGNAVARDRHVLIEGTLNDVPEPGTLLLALAALGALTMCGQGRLRWENR